VRTALRRIAYLAWAEVLHVTRDRTTTLQVILVPVIQLLILGNAATFRVTDSPTYVVDHDRSPTSRGLINRFAASGQFRFVGGSASLDLANDALLRGDVTLVLSIPHDFETTLVKEGRAPIQLSVNGERGSAAGIVQAYASRIATNYSIELTRELRPNQRMVRGGDGEAAPVRGGAQIEVRTQSWYNPTRKYTYYMVPGLLVSLVTLIGTMLTAQNIAREKELGTLEQLNVTPITRSQFIIAKLLPFWTLALIDLTIGLAVGRFVFGIPMVGSVVLLISSAAIYLLVALGIGLWISTVVDTQQQATFVTFFIMMIYLLMSGLFTPIDSMPHWVQVIAVANPVRHFVAVSRAILLKGAGVAEILKPMAILVFMAILVLTFAVRQYNKRTG
jgi:ABC-2 type transport system permease protein